MPYERGRHLFHYTTREAAFAHILPKGRLRFSRYLNMRDPLENKSWRFASDAWAEADEEERRRRVGRHVAFEWAAMQIRKGSFLLSMTQDSPTASGEDEPFWCGWARARMWEQYAEAHFGVCPVFDREELSASVVSSLVEQGFPSPYHREVIYGAGGMLKPALDLASLPDQMSGAEVARYVEDNHDPLFFYKALDWETEREYRFATTSPDLDEPLVDYGSSLRAVIVGERFPVWARPGAIAACRAVDARAERLDWSAGAPEPVELKPSGSRGEEITEAIEATRRRGHGGREGPRLEGA